MKHLAWVAVGLVGRLEGGDKEAAGQAASLACMLKIYLSWGAMGRGSVQVSLLPRARRWATVRTPCSRRELVYWTRQRGRAGW
jgi:hypothetical protein